MIKKLMPDRSGSMQRRQVLACLALASVALPVVAAVNGAPRKAIPLIPEFSTEATSASRSGLSVEEIVQRNVGARDGLEAWRRVQTIRWTGYLRSGSSKDASPPLLFTMELARPNRSRFEVQGGQVHFTRVFDGAHGWKVRPGHNGPEVQDFSADEVKFHQDEFVMDGLLIDHVTKGIAVTLEGINELEGRKAYRLGVRLPSGANRRLWVDAASFLELRCDRPSWDPMSRGKAVSTTFSDYRAVDGLQFPMRIESGPAVEEADSPPLRDSLVIERVVINPELAEQAFARPKAMRSHGALAQIQATGGGGDSRAPGAGATPRSDAVGCGNQGLPDS